MHSVTNRCASLKSSNFYRGILFPTIVLAVIAVISTIATDFGKLSPIGDDAALISGSIHGDFADWFLKGFSDYFYVFPQWSKPYTDFIRPLDNVIIYLQSLVFGRWYTGYFLPYYLAAGAIAWCVYGLCVRNGVTIRYATVAALLCVVSPSLIGPGLTNLAFMFDVVCGAFVISALYFLLQERFVLSLIALTFGVLTKETGLYAPVAAAVSLILWKQNRRWAPIMLAPVALWCAIRMLAFGSLFGGVYKLINHTNRLKSILKGIATWPGGMIIDHGSTSFAWSFGVVALLVANAVLWLYLALSVSPWLLRPQTLVAAFDAPTQRTRATVLIWLTLGLGYCVALGLRSRFGGSVLPLFYLYLALDLSNVVQFDIAPGPFVSRLLSWREQWLGNPIAHVALVCILFFLAAANVIWNVPKYLPSNASNERAFAFKQALQSLPANVRVVFIVNGPESSSRPDSVAAYLGISARLVYVTQVSGCLRANEIRGDGVQIAADGLVTVHLPPCARFAFPGVSREWAYRLVQTGGFRSDVGTYRFPNSEISPGFFMGEAFMGKTHAAFGDQLDWKPVIRPGAAMLTYDWSRGVYITRALEPSVSGRRDIQ
jgi:hypothetical protein